MLAFKAREDDLICLKKQKQKKWPFMMFHICNLSIQEAEPEELLRTESSRPMWGYRMRLCQERERKTDR